jgi:hypothetical protein
MTSMVLTRLLLLVTVVCLGFAAWNIHERPLADFQFHEGQGAWTVGYENCQSVWNRWSDGVLSATTSKSQSGTHGHDLKEAERRACSPSTVRQEHISEMWLAAATLALIAAYVRWRKLEIRGLDSPTGSYGGNL